MKYLVRVRDVCFKDVIVEAADEYDAEDIVEELLLNGQFSVDECEDETIECIREATDSDMDVYKYFKAMNNEYDEENEEYE